MRAIAIELRQLRLTAKAENRETGATPLAFGKPLILGHRSTRLPPMSHEHIDVRYVAKLARLDLSEAEATVFQSQLDSILHHVESLSALELPDDLVTNDNTMLAMMRDDTPGESLDPALVLANAPEQAQGQIRIPKVVADE